MEDLDGGLQIIAVDGNDIGVGVVGEHHRLLLHRLLHRAELVAQRGGALEIEVLGGRLHVVTDLAHHPLGVAPREERAQPVDEFHVF